MTETVINQGWKGGMDNVLPDYALPLDTMRNAVNVDFIGERGKVRRRDGITTRIAAPVHSFFAFDNTALLVKDKYMCLLNEDFTTVQLKALVSSAHVSYTEAGGDIYYSNGVDKGRIVNKTWRAWGIDRAITTPVLELITGVLYPGFYQALVTYADVHGEESGAGGTSLINVPDGTGLRVYLPQPTQPEAVNIRLYLSPPSGEGNFYIGSYAKNTEYVDIVSPPTYGWALQTQFMTSMQPCTLVEFFYGRIYGVSGNILWHTEPFRYGLRRPGSDYIPFPAPIKLIARSTDGMYVVADKTYWLAGTEPTDFKVVIISEYSAAAGSASRMPDSQDVLWYSDVGIVVAGPGGQVAFLQRPNVQGTPSSTGTTQYVELNGVRKILSAVSGDPIASGLSVGDYMDAEIERARR